MKNIDLTTKTNEELKEYIKKTEKAKKIMKKREEELFIKAWNCRSSRRNLETFLYSARVTLGKRKSEGCPALLKKQGTWSTIFSCGARNRLFNYFNSLNELCYQLCYRCRWSHEQARTRMMIIKIQGRKD